MKRALILSTIALAALPLLADEKAKTTETAQPASVAPANAAAQDSPLVAAARRMNRLGKKPTNVITNETLTKSSGTAHITSAATPLKPIALPPPTGEARPTPEMVAAKKAADERKRAETVAAAKKKAEEERQARVHAGARMAEESIEERYEADAESYQGEELREVKIPPPPPPPQF